MTTPLDTLTDALLACRRFLDGAEAPPEAILWCDPGREFAALIPALRGRLPQLLTLGDYDAATRTGPAIWLRAAAGRHLPGVEWPADQPPMIWMPGVGREVLRGAEDCDKALQPLVWYAVAGAFFGAKGRDWTLRRFLTSQDAAVRLDVPEDAATRTALGRAAARLFDEPLAALRGTRWDAAALDSLLAPDPVQDMLRWMDGTLTETADAERFTAFAARAVKDFSFDPRTKSRQDAAARLGRRERAWAGVWERFEDAGGSYEGVVKLLRAEEPQDLLADLSAYPRVNETREAELRRDLAALSSMAPSAAADRLRTLDKAHAWRRATLWARRGEAPLALALRHLAAIADVPALPAHDGDAMARAYFETGWQADAAALHALDIARHGEDRDAVVAALRAVYLPWLDHGAATLQALAAAGKVAFATPKAPNAPPQDAVLLFVDGLRMDLAQELAEQLRARGANVELDWIWSGFPTVTATCKALATPVAASMKAGPASEMLPATADGKSVKKPVLLKALEAGGWSTSETLLADGPVWRECGRFDEEGHALGARLAERTRDGLRDVVEIAMRLAAQGRRVRVVTDHGWLLMPGGLEQAMLDSGLAEPDGKRTRVAALKPGAPTSYTRLPWTWDPAVSLAVATGARAFFAGQEYAHGGVSPQECVLPVLDIRAEGGAARQVVINARWQRLRLKVEVAGGAGLMFDVRLGSDTSGPSVLKGGARQLDDLGQVGVLISEDHLDKQVCLVVHPPGKPHEVLAKRVDTIRD